MNARFKKYSLDFKTPGGTSRGVLRQKDTWILILESNGKRGIGECAMFRGLSADDVPGYEDKLKWLCEHIENDHTILNQELTGFPSIQFGLEQAQQSLASADDFILFPSDFTAGVEGIVINGLVWMGAIEQMKAQVETKLQQGYSCIKIKIGALNFSEELEFLQEVRKMGGTGLEIRVDANGAFSPEDALEKLKALAKLDIHSIEQPISPGQRNDMQLLCKESPIPIALDEELIGIFNSEEKKKLLERLAPPYIILKPSLLGGFGHCEQWMEIASRLGIRYWVTSALESNIGLNAIAQWTAGLGINMPQGLGTGGLFANNFLSPLYVEGSYLRYDPDMSWDIQTLIT
ncbi:MAG: o-succinylbenzoate synthase [Bacteroidia bacterium]|nr:o-succinylbenzoate synthase [Bacteroidia bacterium]